MKGESVRHLGGRASAEGAQGALWTSAFPFPRDSGSQAPPEVVLMRRVEEEGTGTPGGGHGAPEELTYMGKHWHYFLTSGERPQPAVSLKGASVNIYLLLFTRHAEFFKPFLITIQSLTMFPTLIYVLQYV